MHNNYEKEPLHIREDWTMSEGKILKSLISRRSDGKVEGGNLIIKLLKWKDQHKGYWTLYQEDNAASPPLKTSTTVFDIDLYKILFLKTTFYNRF